MATKTCFPTGPRHMRTVNHHILSRCGAFHFKPPSWQLRWEPEYLVLKGQERTPINLEIVVLPCLGNVSNGPKATILRSHRTGTSTTVTKTQHTVAGAADIWQISYLAQTENCRPLGAFWRVFHPITSLLVHLGAEEGGWAYIKTKRRKQKETD